MKVLVSSCIMGKNCKYNGGNNLNPKVVEFLKDKEVIEILINFGNSKRYIQ